VSPAEGGGGRLAQQGWSQGGGFPSLLDLNALSFQFADAADKLMLALESLP